MYLHLLFDPLLLIPLLAGLLAAVNLGLLAPGNALHDEWLGAYALAQCAATGGIMALALGGLPFLGALGGALAGLLGKAMLAPGNRSYAYLWLGAWSVGMLTAAQTGGEALAQSWLEGQLYFANTGQLMSNGLFLLFWLGIGAWLLDHDLRRVLLPHRVTTPAAAFWQHAARLAQASLLALGVALGVLTFGILATFGLLLFPAQFALHRAASWRQAQRWSVAYAGVAYLGAYVVALAADQPFTPVLLLLLLLGLLGVPRR